MWACRASGLKSATSSLPRHAVGKGGREASVSLRFGRRGMLENLMETRGVATLARAGGLKGWFEEMRIIEGSFDEGCSFAERSESE